MGMSYGELHHIFFGSKDKYTIAKCCLKLFAKGNPNHHDEEHGKWVNDLRKAHRENYEKAKANYILNEGCKEEIFECCKWCAMKKINCDRIVAHNPEL